jgi:hypothetical protein
MNPIKIITTATLVVLLSSCNTKSKEDKPATVQVEEHQNSKTKAIELNNSAKWKVDAAMMINIRAMENDVAYFEKTNNNDYQSLASKLKKSIDLLTSNCTMKGQAHDELHKWLLPFIDLVDAFSKDKSNQQFTQIQESLITFNHYFQ